MIEPTVSVVIAANQEESVIARCLHVLTAQAEPGELDVIVVANACTDRTANIARALGARVVETPVPGKAHALALGDAECRTFPRLYLDADIELDTVSVRRMVAVLKKPVLKKPVLDKPEVLACSPTPEYDLTSVSTVARRFHRVFGRLLDGRHGLTGAGAYMLSRSGHERVFPMPEGVLSDDGWAHRSFSANEQTLVKDAHSVVRPARTLSAVIRQRARVRLGNRELDRLGRKAEHQRVTFGDLVALVRRREVRLADAVCFLAVQLADRAVSQWREWRGTTSRWSPDLSSR